VKQFKEFVKIGYSILRNLLILIIS